VGLVRDFGGRQLFLALAIADSFALATHACIVQQLLRSHGCVSDVGDSPWLGLHRISYSDAVPFMPDENNERKQLAGK
jgi:hypothetical protein